MDAYQNDQNALQARKLFDAERELVYIKFNRKIVNSGCVESTVSSMHSLWLVVGNYLYCLWCVINRGNYFIHFVCLAAVPIFFFRCLGGFNF